MYVTAPPESGKCKDLDKDKRKHVRCTGRDVDADLSDPRANSEEHCCYGNTNVILTEGLN